MFFSLTKGTTLENFRLPFEKIFIFIHNFVLGNKSAKILEQLGLEKNIIDKMKKRFYYLILCIVETSAEKIGGEGIILEEDE